MSDKVKPRHSRTRQDLLREIHKWKQSYEAVKKELDAIKSVKPERPLP